MRPLLALLVLLACDAAGPALAQQPAEDGIRQRIDGALGDAPEPGAGGLAGTPLQPPAGPSEAPAADASLATPPSPRLPSPIDDAGIASRIDKGLTAAGEASAIPPDLAYGAFQRGYFLTAFSLALERAREGDAAAQTLLGELLARGLGVKQDLPAAADWYGLAARQGDREALYALGRLFLDGRGVKQDFAAAADHFEQAAKAGHAVAAREFAYLLLQGKGRERNAMLGAAYLRRAAALGDMDAQFALAGLYAEGVGVVADAGHSTRWYGEAARNGHVGAQVEYAIMLFNGRGVAKDEAQAARWFREAARADNPLAQVRLARLLAEGRGVTADAAAAARWYLIARSRGFSDDFLDDWLLRLGLDARRRAEAEAEHWNRAHGRAGGGEAAPAEESAPPTAAQVDKSAG